MVLHEEPKLELGGRERRLLRANPHRLELARRVHAALEREERGRGRLLSGLVTFGERVAIVVELDEVEHAPHREPEDAEDAKPDGHEATGGEGELAVREEANRQPDERTDDRVEAQRVLAFIHHAAPSSKSARSAMR